MGRDAAIKRRRKLARQAIGEMQSATAIPLPDPVTNPQKEPGFRRLTAIHLFLLTTLTFVLGIFPIESEDIFSNIITGQYLWNNKSIPELDPFSFTGPHRWLLNRPLPSVILYWAHSLGGLPGVQIFCTAVIALTFVILYTTWSARTRRPLLSFGVVALTILASCYWFQTRIYVFAYLYTAISLLLVTSANPQALFWCIPLQVLWINSHPSAILGVFFIGLWCFRDLFEKRRVTYFSAAILVSTTLSNIISPMGYKSFVKFAEELFMAHPSRTNILEWLSPFNQQISSQHLAWWFYGACVLMALVTCFCLYNLRTVRSASILLPISLILFALSLGCARHIPLFYLAFIGLLIVTIESLLNQGKFSNLATHRGTLLALYAFVPFVTYKVAYNGYSNGSAHRHLAFGIDSRKFPEKPIQILLKAQIDGNVFSDYDSGSYFLYRTYPRYKAYIDGARLDEVYGEEGFANYMKIGNDLATLKAEIAKYDIRAFIIPLPPSRSEIVVPHRFLSSDPEWKLAYFDDVSMLFVRRDQAQSKEIPTYSFLSPFSSLGDLIKANPDAAAGLERDFRQGDSINPHSVAFQILKARFFKLQKQEDRANQVAKQLGEMCRGKGVSPACGLLASRG
jgi:hypothetical protein